MSDHSSGLIHPGEPAPAFEATDSNGQRVRLADLAGHPVVLIFYPGDDTPVCTAQLCALRDDWSQLTQRGVRVYGVNPASLQRHQRFAGKYNLPFPLLADARGEIARAYGCRALFGLIRRTVYIIGPDGRVVYSVRGNPPVREILAALG
jgi:peroxiredoxin Q/BCP